MSFTNGTSHRALKVGSRKSELAMKQTTMVIDILKEKNPLLEVELVTMDTIGDKILNVALSKIGDKSLFTKELELALLAREVDVVVHSMKDVPTLIADEFALSGIGVRQKSEDAVVMRKGSCYKRLVELPRGSVVGTSSVRRVAQLKQRFGESLRFVSVRGNLNTRLLKMDDPEEAQKQGRGDGERYEAIILARAGLERLGWMDRVTEVLCDEDSLYAVGQGAVACECRADDHETLKLLSQIQHEETALIIIAERSLLRELNGGCSMPIAVRTSFRNDKRELHLQAQVLSVDGAQSVYASGLKEIPVSSAGEASNDCVQRFRESLSAEKREHHHFVGIRQWPISEQCRQRMVACIQLGVSVATKLLDNGAGPIIESIPRQAPKTSKKPNGIISNGVAKNVV